MIRTATAMFMMFLAAAPAWAAEKFFPAAARGAGANNTFFQTDLRIVNLSSNDASFEVAYLPSDSDNTAPQTTSLTIEGRASMAIDDALESLFQLPSGGGALRIRSAADFVATSRTWTPSGDPECPGTYGQFIPALEASSALARGIIANVKSSSDIRRGFRTNIGAMNPNTSDVSIALTLRDREGNSIATGAMTLRPLSHLQQSLSQIFAIQLEDDGNLFVEFTASSPVLAYASVIDNESGDPIYVQAEADLGSPRSATLVIARRWGFDPSVIEVRQGEPITLEMRSIDVDHGVGFSGVGAVSCTPNEAGQCALRPNKSVTVSFTPQSKGSFAFFCTVHCGESPEGSAGHLTMRGTIIVK